MAVLAAGTPIDDVGATIDQALFVEPDKGFAHGGERLASMVKYSRDQSTLTPSRFIWSRMAPP